MHTGLFHKYPQLKYPQAVKTISILLVTSQFFCQISFSSTNLLKPIGAIESEKGIVAAESTLGKDQSHPPALALVLENGRWVQHFLTPEQHKVINKAWESIWKECEEKRKYKISDGEPFYEAVVHALLARGLPAHLQQLQLYIHTPPKQLLDERIKKFASEGNVEFPDEFRLIIHAGTNRDNQTDQPTSFNILMPQEEGRVLNAMGIDNKSKVIDHEVEHLVDRATSRRGEETAEKEISEKVLDAYNVMRAQGLVELWCRVLMAEAETGEGYEAEHNILYDPIYKMGLYSVLPLANALSNIEGKSIDANEARRAIKDVVGDFGPLAVNPLMHALLQIKGDSDEAKQAREHIQDILDKFPDEVSKVLSVVAKEKSALVIDNNNERRELVVEYLEDMGFGKVYEARSIEEAKTAKDFATGNGDYIDLVINYIAAIADEDIEGFLQDVDIITPKSILPQDISPLVLEWLQTQA